MEKCMSLHKHVHITVRRIFLKLCAYVRTGLYLCCGYKCMSTCMSVVRGQDWDWQEQQCLRAH